ncbi:MAG: class I SAM-dependent methyltransferase [bacterium]|nr:MAG: class I SAM-dependent methyltransferase [bacterium]
MRWYPAEPTADEVTYNLTRYRERIALYRNYGHDRELASRFVIDTAMPIEIPVLDIGTGKGFAAAEIARRGIPVDSIDITEEVLYYAHLNAKAAGVDHLISFHVGDAKKLPFEDEKYGTVIMMNALHHLDDYRAILAEISRVLKPGGRFVIADFTDEGFAILDRVHAGEGREHPRRSNTGIDDIALHLDEYSMMCRGRDIRYQEYVMIAEKL